MHSLELRDQAPSQLTVRVRGRQLLWLLPAFFGYFCWCPGHPAGHGCPTLKGVEGSVGCIHWRKSSRKKQLLRSGDREDEDGPRRLQWV